MFPTKISFVIVFPNCKINLGLHIIQKRTDGFHDLETVFYPLPFTDALEMIQQPSGSQQVEFSASGLSLDIDADSNICLKAYRLLKEQFQDLPPIKMHLHKVIPSGAGLGGGSADGAFSLVLLNKKFNLGLREDQLIEYALQLGSDCPFFIRNLPCFATGRGEKMETISLDLGGYSIVLVNPGIHVNTAWAFTRVTPASNRTSLKGIIQMPVENWKDVLINDFEKPVFEKHPEIGIIKNKLYDAGALYASMSGSGSTVYGVFRKNVNPDLGMLSGYFIKTI